MSGPLDMPTHTQQAVLHWPPGAYGLAEIEMDTGVVGAALQASIKSCIRRGWLTSEGLITREGVAALTRAAGKEFIAQTVPEGGAA